MKATLEILFEKLDNNFSAVEHIERSIKDVEEASFYQIFYNSHQRRNEINHLLALKSRVLKMRFRLLENIQLATSKEMHLVSMAQKNINLKKSAA